MKYRTSIAMNIFFIGVLALVQSYCLVSNDDDFARANQLFLAGRYAQACQSYEKIESKGFAVLYNLGLSYLHKGNVTQAMICAQRAEKQATFRELTQLYDLLDYIHREKNPDYAPSCYEQFVIFLKKCIVSISMLFVQLLVIGAILLVIVCWYRRWYPKNSKAFVCMVFFYGMLVSLWWYKTNIMHQQVGIVTKNVISVLSGPDASFYKKSELHEGDELFVISSQPGYYQIKAEQVLGWIGNKDVELV